VPIRFLVGTTKLSLHEMRSIDAGDIVGIEHWTSGDTGLRVRASFGGALGLVIHGIVDGSLVTVFKLEDKLMTTTETNNVPHDIGGVSEELPLDRLDALEVALHFELAELPITLGNLKTLKAGYVFDLGQPLNRCSVRILSHGNVLGSGYLVAVGERLGLRVTEFVAKAL